MKIYEYKNRGFDRNLERRGEGCDLIMLQNSYDKTKGTKRIPTVLRNMKYTDFRVRSRPWINTRRSENLSKSYHKGIFKQIHFQRPFHWETLT